MFLLLVIYGRGTMYFQVDFPLSETYRVLTRMALDFTRCTSRDIFGLTWGEAFDLIPQDVWKQYGFHAIHSLAVAEDALCITELEQKYLIPSYGARLVEISAYMMTYLMCYFEIEPLRDPSAEFLDKITDFILIWAPRFVDTDSTDANEFIENALADTDADFWEPYEEDDYVDPEEYDSRDHYSAVLI